MGAQMRTGCTIAGKPSGFPNADPTGSSHIPQSRPLHQDGGGRTIVTPPLFSQLDGGMLERVYLQGVSLKIHQRYTVGKS